MKLVVGPCIWCDQPVHEDEFDPGSMYRDDPAHRVCVVVELERLGWMDEENRELFDKKWVTSGT